MISLAGCASEAPRVSNAALGYAVTTYAISADANEESLSGALGTALAGVGIATAMPAKASVTIDVVRYNSPIIGFFYGGQHYASLSVVLTENSGARIETFPIYVAVDGDKDAADAGLANEAATIIAAKAANAYMPIKARPIKVPPVAKITPVQTPVVVVAPVADVAAPSAGDSAPCVIGPDGKCVIL